jgi:GNAT superfamily N-acetyltransferase
MQERYKMDLDIGHINIRFESTLPLVPSEPDDFILKYNITATYPLDMKAKDDKTITIAYASVVLLSPSCCHGNSVAEACEAYEQDILDVYRILYYEYEDLIRPPLDSKYFEEIWYLERFFVDAEFRNRGLGSLIIKWIENFLCCGHGAIVVLPRPLSVKNLRDGRYFVDITEKYSPELKEKLINFYEKQGFTKLRSTSYMYRVTERKYK